MRFLLFPFSWIYGFVTYVRNKLYDQGVFASYKAGIRTIVIGNLQVGGAGKTPMTAFLFKYLSADYNTAILSRGYGRKTRGLIEAGVKSSAREIGDEPVWYKRTLDNATVVVAEKRKEGLQYLEQGDTSLVLLDDAYQHRSVTCDIYLLLTDYHTPYYRDFPLPAGRLREYRTEDKRADIIVVTKCPETMTLQDKVDRIQSINPYDYQHVFFTSVKPGRPYLLKGNKDAGTIRYNKIIAMSGIANPGSFVQSCKQFNRAVEALSFRDHHAYTLQDIDKAKSLAGNETIIMITEKDAVKLSDPQLLAAIPDNLFMVLPIEVGFLFGEENKFREIIAELLKHPSDKEKSFIP
jgi:tetraacyldisaccharide 4'-kinase